MSIAITEDHRALGQTASDFLAKHDSRGAARALLEAEARRSPPSGATWPPWAGSACTCPRSRGGSGFGLPELVVVVEELGRAVTPGPFVPTVIASAVIDASRPTSWPPGSCPGWPTDRPSAAVALDVRHHRVRGQGLGDGSGGPGRRPRPRALLPAGDDVIVVDASDAGVTVEVPGNLDPTRRTARVTLDGAPAEVIPGGRQALVDLARLIIAAEAAGHRSRVHRAGRRLRQGAGAVRPAHRHLPSRQAPLRQHARGLRAGDRNRVGRRPGGGRGGRPASLPGRRHGGHARSVGGRRVRAAQHPGARRHRLHLGARRPPVPPPGDRTRGGGRCARRRTGHHRPGARWARAAERTIDLPPEAEPMRDEVRRFAERVKGLGRGRATRRHDRDRVRHAALAQALGARRRCGRATGH